MCDSDVPHFEKDGTLSWKPERGERLTKLVLRKKNRRGQWLETVHCPPAEIHRAGMKFYIRKPKRAGSDVWHTTVIDVTHMPVRIEEDETARGKTVTVTVLDSPLELE